MEFSTICDKVRKGDCDEEVETYMQKHVRACPSENNNMRYAKGKLSIVVTTNLKIYCLRVCCKKKLYL